MQVLAPSFPRAPEPSGSGAGTGSGSSPVLFDDDWRHPDDARGRDGARRQPFLERLEPYPWEDLSRILAQVRAGLRERGVDENNFQEIYSEIVKGKLAWAKQQEKKELPRGVLNRSSTLFFVEKEMQRAVRYATPFSIVLFAIIRAIPRAKVPPGAIQQQQVYQAVVERMVRVVRNPRGFAY